MVLFLSSPYCKLCKHSPSQFFVQRRKKSRHSFVMSARKQEDLHLLVLSNGHGEDRVAASIVKRLLDALDKLPFETSVEILPLVGSGPVYSTIAAGLTYAGPTKELPSGGFINQRPVAFLRDIGHGLLSTSYSHYRTVRNWSLKAPNRKLVLAVGDVWPLFLAAQSGAPYVFIGTAKSEYYIRDENGPLMRRNQFEQFEAKLSSVYYPWERRLLQRALAVYPRDALTCFYLLKCGIRNTKYLGNPMMDDLDTTGKLLATIHSSVSLSKLLQNCETYRIVLLPGSRSPEMYRNLLKILNSIKSFACEFRSFFVLCCSPSASKEKIHNTIWQSGWIRTTSEEVLEYQLGQSGLLVTFEAFPDCLQFCTVGIAMAGTATEQLVGVGKPVITLFGDGPQFTPAFAEAQKRLLGDSVFLLQDTTQLSPLLHELCTVRRSRRQAFVDNGIRRLGLPGASKRITRDIIELITSGENNIN
eukprot:jgi/Galph1/6069/GphlegSOOS_G4727.1